ncbi:GNAT family N-acetyltransferase [Flavobacterium sharifuzzamanii]|uniref:GNAT family N-acetyltransferase n=1 Tax=Flavobacterium sharifuzzamanii TaxID=2211133 RepID=UPI000DAB54AA|nr:GNAT family N-acetyltransferase [Flavobacterium sharifuzzamanii]KAF2082727.1 GNAT family N-acetyltransferase [Flavobacterium sharifuzzamanii]
MELNFRDFPKLITERLILRNIENTDVVLIHKLHSDAIVNAFVGRDNSSSLKKAEEYIIKMQNLIARNECIYWVITEKGNNNLIGSVCLWNFDIENEIVEIGYEMLSEFQGKGIMTEAIKKVIEYAFEKIKAKMITAFPSSDNINSVSILKKMNFELENKKYNNTHENIKNLVTYTLRNDQINK